MLWKRKPCDPSEYTDLPVARGVVGLLASTGVCCLQSFSFGVHSSMAFFTTLCDTSFTNFRSIQSSQKKKQLKNFLIEKNKWKKCWTKTCQNKKFFTLSKKREPMKNKKSILKNRNPIEKRNLLRKTDEIHFCLSLSMRFMMLTARSLSRWMDCCSARWIIPITCCTRILTEIRWPILTLLWLHRPTTGVYWEQWHLWRNRDTWNLLVPQERDLYQEYTERWIRYTETHSATGWLRDTTALQRCRMTWLCELLVRHCSLVSHPLLQGSRPRIVCFDWENVSSLFHFSLCRYSLHLDTEQCARSPS